MSYNMPSGGYTTPAKPDPENYRHCEGCGEFLPLDVLTRDPWNESDYWCADDECWSARAKVIGNYDGPDDGDTGYTPTEQTASYREDLKNAGRGHLVR